MSETGRKLLVISGVFPPDRIAEGDHILNLCRRLAERGYQVDVVTRKGPVDDAGLPFRVHPVMPAWTWANVPRLLKIARRVAPDTVFIWFASHTFGFHPMLAYAPAILKRALPGANVVSQITCMIGSRPKMLTRMVRKAVMKAVPSAGLDYEYGVLFRDSDRVIAMADTHLQFFVSKWPRLQSKISLIPPPPLLPMSPADPASRARGRQALGIDEQAFVFAYFGRLRRYKGLETLLRAFRVVRARQPNVKLAIIGGPDEDWFQEDWRVEDLHALAVELAITDDVVWTGEFPWDSDRGSTYLRAVDVAVLPFDAGIDLNNSSFAAVAAHGLPTITTRGADFSEPFHDGQNVLLCPPLDPAATAAAMERLLIDAGLRQRLRAGIEAIAQEWFSWEVSVDRTIAAFGTAKAPPGEQARGGRRIHQDNDAPGGHARTSIR